MLEEEYLTNVRRWVLRFRQMELGDLQGQYQNFLLLRDRVHGVHYDKKDPAYDAWMFLCGSERICFDNTVLKDTFVGMDIESMLRGLRLKLGIRKL